jgi:hypothetical protein
MKKALKIWIGIVLAVIAAGAAVGAVIGDQGTSGRVGSGVIAALFAAAALRTWYLAGESAKPPTGVEG